jgi:hypothetical protein
MTARIEQSREALTGIGDDEAVVILARSLHNGNDTETGFIDCIDQQLGKGAHPLRVIPDEIFRDSYYPWFEPRTAPKGPADLPRLLTEPALAAKLAENKVRYLIWIEGSTEALEGGGSISCAAGAGAGGCFGLMWWEKDSDYEASVWDVKKAIGTGRVSTDVNGMSVVPAVVVPIPLIAPTQGKACRRLAEQLRMFIVEGVT